MSADLLSILQATLSEIPQANSGNFYQLLARLCGAGGSVSPVPAPAVSFVWRPGGTPSANVFTTAEDLFTATEAIDGLVFVAVDTSLGAAQITNVRPYDAGNILWLAELDTTPAPVVQVLAGAQVTNLCRNTRVVFELQPNGAPVLLYPDAGTAIVLNRGAAFRNTGSSPAIVRTTPDPLVFVLQEFASLDPTGIAPILDLGVDGVTLINIDDLSEWGNGTIIGGAAAFISCQYTLGSRLPNSVAGFTGTYVKNRFPPPAQNEKWCAQNGDDVSGDGSLERPYRTIARALQDDVGQPMVVNLQNGTYTGVDIPTSPVPRPSLTIQGEASRGANEVTVSPGPSGSAFNLQPGIPEAPFLRSLVLRNMNCDGDGVAPAVRVVNAPGSPANTFMDSSDGLWIEACFLNGNGTDALFVERAGRVNLLSNEYNGNVQMGQCGGGFALNNEHLSGTWFVLFDPTITGPLTLLPFRFKSCNLLDTLFAGSPIVEIDAATKGQVFYASPTNSGAGAQAIVECRGKFSQGFVEFDPADVLTHQIDLDQSKMDELSAYYIAPGSAIRQFISFQNGVSGDLTVDEKIDLDAMDTTAQNYLAGGVGVDRGTIDRRHVQVGTNVDVVPTVVAIDPPLPTNVYNIGLSLNALPAVAISTTVNPIDGASFSHQSTAGAAAELASCLLTRY